MRQKRAKTYRKLLAAYIRHFGLRPPLQILIDAPMALALANMKMESDDVAPRLEAVLQVSAALPSGATRPTAISSTGGPGHARANKAALVKPMITQCCIVELYNQQKESEAAARAVVLAKTWERRYCNHKSPIAGDKCMAEMVGENNKHRYVLAANSAGLRNRIRRNVPGVAIVHTNDHHVLVLEPMSDLTKAKCDELEREKLKAAGLLPSKRPASGALDGDNEAAAEDAATATNIPLAQAPPQPPRKKRAKEPNPLSVKKKSKDGAGRGKQRSSVNGAAGAKAGVAASNTPSAGRSGAARRKRKKEREQAMTAAA